MSDLRGPKPATNPLAQLRVERRMTMQEVADQIGVTRQAVSHWETGQHEPTVKYADAYAKAIGVDIADVIAALAASREAAA